MKHRVLKNTIAILAFILFVLFLIQKFVTKYDNSAMLLKLNNFKADNVEEETIEGTLKEGKSSILQQR